MAQNDYVAVVALVEEIADREQTIHSWMERDGKKMFMRFPQVIFAEGDGTTAMLYRYRMDGEFCGDTWHSSLKEAQQQAEFEYRAALGSWSPVPRDVTDTRAYALLFAQRMRRA